MTQDPESFEDQLRRAIDPDVSEVRLAIFGRKDPPFPSAAEAVHWIEAQERQQRGQISQLDHKAITARIKAFIQDLKEETGLPWAGPTVAFPKLAYCRPREEEKGDDQVCHVRAWPNPHLRQLAAVVRQAAERTGFHETEITAYVLTGRHPRRLVVTVGRREYWIRLPTEGGVFRREVNLTIHTPDLKYKLWRELYRMVLAEWQLVRWVKPSEKAKKVHAIVQRLGGEPSSGKTEFWRKAMGIVNDEIAHEERTDERERPYTRWESVRKAYREYERKRRETTGIVDSENPAR
jgi:hypothetical protein